jgi:hypothetical protein
MFMATVTATEDFGGPLPLESVTDMTSFIGSQAEMV